MDSKLSLASFGSAFNQHARILRLGFAPGNGIAEDTLLPQRLKGEERLSDCFRYRLECLSADSYVELKDLLGQPVEIAILLADGRERVLAVLDKRINSRSFREESVIDQGRAGSALSSTLEDYRPQTLYYSSDSDDVFRYAGLRQQAHDLEAKGFEGRSTVRNLSPGTWFQLADHPIHDHEDLESRQFVVTSLHFVAENNLTPELRQRLGAEHGNDATGQNRPPYTNTFQAVRRDIPLVPRFDDAGEPGAELGRGHLTQLTEAVHILERGSNTDRDGKSGQGGQSGGQSIVAVNGPHGVAVGSQKSVTIDAGTNLDQVAQRDLH